MSSVIDLFTVVNEEVQGRLAKLKFSNLLQQFTKKHDRRLMIYNTILDFMNSSTNTSDIKYFAFHLQQIDRRATKSPFFMRRWLQLTKTKNEQVIRDFLGHCIERSRIDEMKNILKPFMPLDEYSLYMSDDSSDQRPIIQSLIKMCEEKIETAKQLKAIVTGNAFIIFFACIIHYIAVSALYPSFLPADVLYGDRPTRELTVMENNWFIYQWIFNNIIMVAGVLGALAFSIGYSMNNWHKRGISIRKEFLDFLPPYSIHKITGQYQIVLMTYFYLRSGKKWLDTLDAVRRLSPKYIQRQIDEIIMRSSSRPSEQALNTFYMGELGDIIESRVSRDSLEKTLEGTLSILQKRKLESIAKTTSRLKLYFVVPLVWGSVAYSLVPIAFHIGGMIAEAQAASNM
jgi:type II secretory pathway component PulF